MLSPTVRASFGFVIRAPSHECRAAELEVWPTPVGTLLLRGWLCPRRLPGHQPGWEAHARWQCAAHLLELGARRHLLREQRRLDAMEEALQPTNKLGLGDPQLGLGGQLVLGKRE
jgi:hypothetical protein